MKSYFSHKLFSLFFLFIGLAPAFAHLNAQELEITYYVSIYGHFSGVTIITDPAGNVRRFEYEPIFNKLIKITDPLSQVTSFEYDAKGNLTATVDPTSARTTIAYNSFGQPTSTTDPLGNVTTFTYDSVGNLVTIADPLGNRTQRFYDAVSRLSEQIDPRGRSTRFSYDGLNRITQILDALFGLTQFAYDGNGNLLTVTDARGSTITHTYDSMDRLATRTNAVGSIESFVHDAVGNLTQHQDFKGQVYLFTYDVLNRRSAATYADGSQINFVYDAASRVTEVADTGGETILNTYDILDRLVAQTTSQGTISYSYDTLGRRSSMSVPGRPTVSYIYDANSRLTEIAQGAGTRVNFSYDAAGRRTQQTSLNGVTTEYSYDGASRLVGILYRTSTGVIGDISYTYDSAGNRTSMGGSLARLLMPDPVLSGSYDAANRQISFGNKSMTYDGNGNLTSLTDPSGTTIYTWDARNRLVALSGPGVDFQAKYDTANRRIEQIVNGQRTSYLYDGPDIVQTFTPDGTAVNYLSGLQVDEPLVREGSEIYLTDALGSVIALADPSGTINTEYRYSPFGITQTTGVASGNPLKFTGREQDSTGLHFNRARYYHPELKRFISEDPLGLEAGVNLYTYGDNNPLSYTDPFGLCRDPGGKGMRFCLESFIPANDIGFGIKGDGDNRSFDPNGGTYRTHQGVSADLRSRTSEAKPARTGQTTGPFGLTGQASGATLKQSVEFTLDGGAIVRFSGNEAIPTIPGAPGVTVDLKIKISDKGEMCVTGVHDGFPGYELWAYREGRPPDLLYGFMPDLKIKLLAPLKLLPIGGISVRRCTR